MPEVVIGSIDVQQIKGRVDVPGRGEHDVTVHLSDSGRSALVEVSAPDGQVHEATIGGPLLHATDARNLLEAAVRGALIEEVLRA